MLKSMDKISFQKHKVKTEEGNSDEEKRIGQTALNKVDDHVLSHDSKYCLVGEAWGFSGRHAGYYIAPLIPLIGCWTCVKYGRAMGKISSRKKEYSGNKITDPQLLVDNFLKHWNEKHRNITERLMKMRV
jgi:hypothetical protein